MTDDLVAFLNRALDEEAETARAAGAEPWFRSRDEAEDEAQPDGPYPMWPMYAVQGGEGDDPVVYNEGVPSRAQAAHIARQDPQATLDRVEGLRLVLAQHRRDGVGDKLYCLTCATDIDFGGDREGDWPCPTLRALASAYRRHPDYDQAWLPDGVGVDA